MGDVGGRNFLTRTNANSCRVTRRKNREIGEITRLAILLPTELLSRNENKCMRRSLIILFKNQ